MDISQGINTVGGAGNERNEVLAWLTVERACVHCRAVCHDTPSFGATAWHAACIDMFSARMRSSTKYWDEAIYGLGCA